MKFINYFNAFIFSFFLWYDFTLITIVCKIGRVGPESDDTDPIFYRVKRWPIFHEKTRLNSADFFVWYDFTLISIVCKIGRVGPELDDTDPNFDQVKRWPIFHGKTLLNSADSAKSSESRPIPNWFSLFGGDSLQNKPILPLLCINLGLLEKMYSLWEERRKAPVEMHERLIDIS